MRMGSTEGNDDMLDQLFKDTQEDIRIRKETLASAPEQDGDDLFGQTVTAELRSFTGNENILLKQEITNVIYKYQNARMYQNLPVWPDNS